MANVNGNAGAVANTAALSTIDSNTTTSVTVSRDSSWNRQLDPVTWDDVAKRALVLGKAFNVSPEVAAAKILAGRELGLSVMQAYRGVHIIEGQPALSANMKEAICLAHPEVCERFEMKELTLDSCTYVVKRRGRREQEYTFTMDEARNAGLVDRGKDPKMNNWNRYPKRMLAARAKSLAADMEFSDLLLGFSTSEEMEDERRVLATATATVDGQPIQVQVQASTSEPSIDRPARDMVAEVDAIKQRITDAKTAEERKAARAAVTAFVADLGPTAPESEEVKRFYNMIHGKAAAAAPASAAPATDPDPTEEPST